MWADVLFAMDWHWWREYGVAVSREGFRGERFSCAARAAGCVRFQQAGVRFSGEGALLLAVSRGAARVVLLGYDCQKIKGRRAHHHGDHPKTLGNAGKAHLWAGYLAETAKRLEGVEVVNCTRETALAAFRRAPLEEVLS